MAELALLDKAFSNIITRLVETGQAGIPVVIRSCSVWRASSKVSPKSAASFV